MNTGSKLVQFTAPDHSVNLVCPSRTAAIRLARTSPSTPEMAHHRADVIDKPVTPHTKLAGDEKEFFSQRDFNLESAREQRRLRRQQQAVAAV